MDLLRDRQIVLFNDRKIDFDKQIDLSKKKNQFKSILNIKPAKNIKYTLKYIISIKTTG